MVKLAKESVESASDDLENGMASYPMSSSRDVEDRFLFVLACFFSVLVRDAVTFPSARSGQCAEHPARDCGTLGV